MKKCLTSKSRLIPSLAGIFLLALLLCPGIHAWAQTENPITGTIVDEKGAPLQGVSVTIRSTTTGTSTDSAGHFTIRAAKGATLVFSYIKYGTQEVVFTSQRSLSITMTPTTTSLNDVVVVGYGTQRKATLTGAVAQIGGAEIVTTRNENIENMLTGKVPGLQILQNTAEPGDYSNSISIRGMGNPLIVVDGVQMPDFSVTQNSGDNNVGSSNILTRLDPNDIESISVLKDASASVYGVKAANGVILVTTKRGKSGSLQLSYTGTYGQQVPSGLPKPVNATQYMTLVNQQALHNANGGILTYTPADFDAYANGTKKSSDWYDAVFRKHAMQMQHNLTATGGSDNTTYLISGGYTDQDGLLKSGDLGYKRYNVRSNVTSRIGKRITINLNLSGIMDTKNAPSQSFWWITRETWREQPVQTFYANNQPPYYTNGIVDGGNPIAYMNDDLVGYTTQKNYFLNGALSIDYKVPYIDGLTLRAFYSYNDQIQDNKFFQKTYNLYTYDGASQTFNPTLNGSPSYVQRQYYHYPKNTDQFSINYQHNFGGIHNVSALLLMEGNEQSADNFAAYRQLAIPVDQIIAGNSALQNATQDGGNTALYQYATNSFVGRVTYDFNSRYLAEFSFRDDQSSRFAPGQGWGFFPSGQLGWRISEEPFWKKIKALDFIDNLKFRGSYGVLGDDGQLYYQFLKGYNYPASGNNISNNRVPPGSVFGNSFLNAVQSTGIPNPNVTWSTSHTTNVGFDLDAWKGLLSITADYFVRNRKGLLASSVLQVPEVLGATLPQENINGDQTKGFDFEISHRNHFRKFSYNIKATFSYANTMNTKYAQSKQGNSYLDWRNDQANRNQGIQWGYGGDGQYGNYGSILNSPIYVNRGIVVGDYIYQDWNGDGQIDDNDVHPIAYGGTPNGLPIFPKITYGLTLSGSWNGLDLSLLFQGSAIYNVSYIEQLNIPLWGGGSALTYFLNDYHPADPNANPYDPNTKWVAGRFPLTGTTAMTNSIFNFQNASYLRLKSTEIGYSLADHLIRRTGLKGVRFFLSGYNLLTFTKVKYVDPEHPSGTYGYLYPLDKIFNAGLNIKF
jgi:TonB-linked SusC/RagA family outer membrane protein